MKRKTLFPLKKTKKSQKAVLSLCAALLLTGSFAGCNASQPNSPSVTEESSAAADAQKSSTEDPVLKDPTATDPALEDPTAENPSKEDPLKEIINHYTNGALEDPEEPFIAPKHYELISQDAADSITAFGVNVLKSSRSSESTLISPLSIFSALSMAANGADKNTLSQMEEVLGMSVDEMRQYMNTYMETLEENGSTKVLLANSIWMKENGGFTFSQDLLDSIAHYYRAEFFHEPFDSSSLDKINSWIDEHTDHMIPKVLENISPDAMMYLINALVFDAKWATEYEEYNLFDRTFTDENGRETTVEFMHSSEGTYLSDENTTGFVKYYKGAKYAFVGLLPEEGLSMDDYVASLSGEKIQNLLNTAKGGTVHTAIPEFEKDYRDELSALLQGLGMEDAFSETMADFDKFTEEDNHFFISQVIHQTHIEVNPKGTKAAAVTVIEITESACAVEEPLEEYFVYLDRPFVYMLIDLDQNIPLFIGTLEEVL